MPCQFESDYLHHQWQFDKKPSFVEGFFIAQSRFCGERDCLSGVGSIDVPKTEFTGEAPCARIKNYQATHRIIVEKLIDALMEELLTEIGATKDGAA